MSKCNYLSIAVPNYQPVEVEAIAACRAVEFGSKIGVDCAIVEGDSELIVKALRMVNFFCTSDK